MLRQATTLTEQDRPPVPSRSGWPAVSLPNSGIYYRKQVPPDFPPFPRALLMRARRIPPLAVAAMLVAACCVATAQQQQQKSQDELSKKASRFVRMTRDGTGKKVALQTAIVRYRPADTAKTEPTTIRASGIVAAPISLQLSKINWGTGKELTPTITPKTSATVALLSKFLTSAGPFS